MPYLPLLITDARKQPKSSHVPPPSLDKKSQRYTFNTSYHGLEFLERSSATKILGLCHTLQKNYAVFCTSNKTFRLLFTVMTMHLGHYFSFTYPSPFSFPIYCTMDTLPSLLVMPCELCPSPLLSITHLTLTLTVLPTRASVPADVHLSCPSNTRLSSLLPYVSLHCLCTLPDPPTCVTPRPLYAS